MNCQQSCAPDLPMAADATVSEIIRDLEIRDVLGLAKRVAAHHQVPLTDVLGKTHARPESRARRELWALVYEQIRSYSSVGRLFRRDHTTIRTAVRKYQAELRVLRSCTPQGRRHPFPAEGMCTCNEPTPQATSPDTLQPAEVLPPGPLEGHQGRHEYTLGSRKPSPPQTSRERRAQRGSQDEQTAVTGLISREHRGGGVVGAI